MQTSSLVFLWMKMCHKFRKSEFFPPQINFRKPFEVTAETVEGIVERLKHARWRLKSKESLQTSTKHLQVTFLQVFWHSGDKIWKNWKWEKTTKGNQCVQSSDCCIDFRLDMAHKQWSWRYNSITYQKIWTETQKYWKHSAIALKIVTLNFRLWRCLSCIVLSMVFICIT